MDVFEAPLTMAEQAEGAASIATLGEADPARPVILGFTQQGLDLAREVAAHYYGSESFLNPAEQIPVLQAISEEQEGIVLALKTPTPVSESQVRDQQMVITQAAPKGRQ